MPGAPAISAAALVTSSTAAAEKTAQCETRSARDPA